MFSDEKHTLVKAMHRKIVFVKVESSALKYLKTFIDLDVVKPSVLQGSEMKFYWDPKEQSIKRHHGNIRFPKETSAAHWRSTVVFDSK